MAFPIGITKTPEARKLTKYSNAFVFANGKLLLQAASVTLQKKANSSPQNTLHKGFAGQSKGAGVIEVTIDNAVPVDDIEFVGGALPDYWVQSGEPIEIGIVMGSRTTRLRGFIDEASYSHSTNDAARVSIHLIGRLEAFE
jgi:hypothetical protein